jgi:hypothetical protein
MKLTQYQRGGSVRVVGKEPEVCAFVVRHICKDRFDLEIGNAPGSTATLVRVELTAEEARTLVAQSERALR